MNTPLFLKKIPFAHRGLHGEFPENSLPAFQAAADKGYGIETDVRLTADGKLIAFHDDDLFRLTGIRGDISALTYREVQALRLQGGEKIPLFSECLEAAAGAPLLVEIKHVKGRNEAVARALSQAIEGYRGEYAVQSFDPFAVRAYRALHPEIPCGFLGTAERFPKGAVSPIHAFAVKYLPFTGWMKPDFLSYRLQDLPRRKFLHFGGVRLVWVVRSPEDRTTALQYADNIIFEDFLPDKG